MKNLSLRQRFIDFLKNAPETMFTAREIAEALIEQDPKHFQTKKGKSIFIENDSQLRNQVVAEIGANRPAWEKAIAELRSTDGVRPRRYFWTTKTEAEAVQDSENLAKNKDIDTENEERQGSKLIKVSEYSLYPILIQYMEEDREFRGFRIDEKKSSNKNGAGGNKWLFPDIVGFEYLHKGTHREVLKTIKESGFRQLCLWSFEVKVLLNRSNVREAYFQAVSNSSWSNFGYLVCNRIEGAGTLNELRILYAMHGIGVIQLDFANPSESQILIPAIERQDIEWQMVSRLAFENKDFENFIRLVRQFYQTGDMS